MDPVIVMTTISVALKLVDQFRELALRWVGGIPQPPSGRVEQVGNTIRISHHGVETQTITAAAMHLDQWDSVRYRALDTRARLSWGLFNELYAQLPLLGGAELARVRLTMENTRGELCADFREMVAIYERTLGTSLPDHYQLYEVCSS